MTSVTRVGDLNTGHDSCPAVRLIEGSPNVFINGRAVGRVGDSYESHGCTVHSSHIGKIASGAPHVFVNKRAVGRIGDLVSCGGTVAEGSTEVTIGNGGGELTGNSIMASVDKTVLWSKAEDTAEHPDRTILSLPDICQNMHDIRISEDKATDAQGWLYLKQMFEKWISGSASSLNDNSSSFLIDYEWLYNFLSVKTYQVDLENNALNYNGQLNLFSMLDDKLDQTEFDFTPSYNTTKPNYVNSRLVNSDFGYNFNSAEGAYVALGSFMLYAFPKGTIEKISDNEYKITVTELYCGVFDRFNFDGDQDYRYWSWKNKLFSFSLLCTNNDEKKLTNESFQSFKKNYTKGSDFYVKSNLYKVKDFTSISFIYKR